MFSRLRRSKAKLDAADAETRVKAIAQLSEAGATEAQEQLAELALNDTDHNVRAAALGSLRAQAPLAALLDDAEFASRAAARLIDLDQRGELKLDESVAGHSVVLTTRLDGANAEEAVLLLAKVDDLTALVNLAIASKALRQQALEHPLLQSGTGLNALERASRHRDKSLNRHARDRLDRLKHLRTACEHARQRATELIDALARHQQSLPADEALNLQASSPDGRQAQAQFRDKQRALLDNLNTSLEQYTDSTLTLGSFGEEDAKLDALRGAHARLSRDAAALEARLAVVDAPPGPSAASLSAMDSPGSSPAAGTSPDADSDSNSESAAPQTFDGLTSEFQNLAHALRASEDFSALSERRQQLTQSWLMLADHQQPEPDQHAVFDAVSHDFAELAAAHARLERIEWPDLSAPELVLPEATSRAKPDEATAMELWREVDGRRKRITQLKHLMTGLDWPGWAMPTPAIVAALEGLRALDAQQHRFMELEDRELDRLHELSEALMEHVSAGQLQPAMSALSEARRIEKRLPRDPGHPRNSRASRLEALGKSLNRSAARLAELRDWQTFATSPKRLELRDAMRTLVDSPHPPADQADRIKALRRQWQGLGPPSRGDDRKLSDEFNALAEQAFEPCRVYFEDQAHQRQANLEQRRQICQQLADYLAATDWGNADIKAAEQILRAARTAWRGCHPVDRNPGKPVEERFETLQSELHEHIKTAWDENLARKRAIVEEAGELAASERPLADRINSAKQLQHRWREVGATPRRPDQQLWGEFRAACDAIFNAREEERQAREEERHARDEALVAAEEDHRRLQDEFAAHLEALTPESVDASDLRAYRRRFQDLPHLSERRQSTIEKSFDELARTFTGLLGQQQLLRVRQQLDVLEADDSRSAIDTGEATEPALYNELYTMTLNVEIKVGVEPLPEDRERRLELQVAKLNAGLGGHRDDAEPDPLALAGAWCELGPKRADTAKLRGRFFQALRGLIDR